jgi:hypothetical protein
MHFKIHNDTVELSKWGFANRPMYCVLFYFIQNWKAGGQRLVHQVATVLSQLKLEF